MPQKNFQLTLPDSELDRLKSRIEADYTNALSDHDRRLTRHMEQYRRWRNRYTPNPEREADKRMWSSIPISAPTPLLFPMSQGPRSTKRLRNEAEWAHSMSRGGML